MKFGTNMNDEENTWKLFIPYYHTSEAAGECLFNIIISLENPNKALAQILPYEF